jgi:hypothetical protein
MSITSAGRGLSANMVSDVTASQLSPVLLASLQFSTPVYLWTGYGNISSGGVTYLGLGTFGNISQVEETTDLAARGISMQISGVPTANVAIALTEQYALTDCRDACLVTGHRVLGPDGRDADLRRRTERGHNDDRGISFDGF